MGTPKSLGSKHLKKGMKIFLLILPIMLFIIVFTYYPLIKNIIYSVSRVNQKGVIKKFVGFDNFKSAYARPDFLPALQHTLIIAAINVPLTLIITVTLAFIANKKRKLSPVYETMFTMPMSISMSAACMIFKSMLSPSVGFINYFFGWKCGWFEDTHTALMACLTLTIWMGIGFDFLLMQSALRGIPASVMEATRIDGISPLRRIFKVQLPLISPTIFYVLCTNLVLAMMTSAPMIIIFGYSAEGTAVQTVMSMMYKSGFSGQNYSLAAVLSLTGFILTLGFTILSFVFEKKKVHYQ